MKLIIAITSFLLIFIAIVVLLPQLMTTSIQTAIIQDVQGDVQIGERDNTHTAKENEKLKENYVIITQDSTATVVLYESIIIFVEPNSMFSVYNLSKNKIDLSLPKGKAWIKATGLNGITEIELSTGWIDTTLYEAEIGLRNNYIEVFQGNVESFIYSQWYEINPQETISVDEAGLVFGHMQKEHKAKAKINAQKTLLTLKNIRTKELEHITKYSLLLKIYHRTNKAEIENFIQDLDDGNIPTEQAFLEAPLKTQSMHKLIGFSEAINKQEAYISSFS